MSRNSTLLSNNKVHEMEANYLNMEGGAWGSSQVGGASAGFPPAKVGDKFTIDGINVPGKSLKAANGTYQASYDLANKLVAAQTSNDDDTPYFAPRPDGNSTLEYKTALKGEIAVTREALKRFNPASVAKHVSVKSNLAIDIATGKVVLDSGFVEKIRKKGVSSTDQMIADYAQFAKTKKNGQDWVIDDQGTMDAYAGFTSLKKTVNLDFLPAGGSGDYANHLPSSDFVSGLPGALAIANFQPQRLMPPVMGLGLVNTQLGGGAMVYSNTPSVRKYCGDGNFLAKRIEALRNALADSNIKLTASSTDKVTKMLNVLKAVEGSLCVAHDKMDALLGSKGDESLKDPTEDAYDLDGLNASLSELKAKKRKLSGQALSTIMTLEDVMYKAASQALKDNKTEKTGQPGEQQAIQ
jgi:hypothetical protein